MKFEERIMNALAGFIIRFYRIIPFVALGLIVLCIMGASNIELKTKIEDLLPENNPKIEMYKQLNEFFSGGSLVMITIEGTDKAVMAECAEYFVSEVRKNKLVMDGLRAMNLKVGRDYIRKWGLLLQEAKDLEKTQDMLKKTNLLPFITALNDSFEKTYTGDDAEEEIESRRQETDAVAMLNQLENFFTLLKAYLEKPGAAKEEGRILAEAFLYGDEYGFNSDNTMLLFTLSPKANPIEVEKISALMKGIKAIRGDVQQKFPGLSVSYTGDAAIQGDEQDAMSFDMSIPSYIALALILILFIFSFRQIRSILFVIIALICGIIFSFGILGFFIGEINMLTSIMAVLLIGLGVDYGIMVISNFNTFRADGFSPEEALRSTFVKAGMGTILAAVTTIIGFLVLAAAGSKSFAQFGIVMGIGILMCLIAMFFILPSLLLLWGWKKNITRTRIPKINYDFLAKLGTFTSHHRWTTLVIAVIVTTSLALSAVFLNKYEYDMMKLEPQGMPSVVQYKKVMEKFDINPFASMVITESIEEARELTEKLEKEKLVAEVNSISRLVPDKDEIDERIAVIRNIHDTDNRIDASGFSAGMIKQFTDELNRLEDNILEIAQLSVAGLGENNKILKKQQEIIREMIGSETGRPGKEVFQNLIALIESDPVLYGERLTLLDKAFASEMDMIIREMSDIKPGITQQDILDDLPENYRKMYFDASGTRNMITIYPRQDIFVDLKNMERFNNTLYRVSPKITGTSQVMAEWLNEFNSAMPKAGLLIFISVIVFLILTFRSVKLTVFSIIPLLAGMIWMLGLYPLFGFRMNIINVIMIPLIIGMGIDYSIHITHRYTTEGKIDTTYRYTGRGVFLSAATTMIGFGSLALIGSFPSIKLIGMILFLGIASCLVSTLVFLPALLGFVKVKKAAIEK